jgi:hypothetical protein
LRDGGGHADSDSPWLNKKGKVNIGLVEEHKWNADIGQLERRGRKMVSVRN